MKAVAIYQKMGAAAFFAKTWKFKQQSNEKTKNDQSNFVEIK